MKPIIQFSIALLAILTLSACGVTNNIKKTQQDSENSTTTTYEIKQEDEELPFFKPLFASFHMGSINPNPNEPNTMRFPVVTKKIKSVYVKAYRVNKEHFHALHGQQPGMVESEGKLDTSTLNANEKKPFFEGTVTIHETGPLLSIPRWGTLSDLNTPQKEPRMKGYIEIPTKKAAEIWPDEGYYYFEFESPERLETTGEKTYLNSLLEVVETQGSYEE